MRRSAIYEAENVTVDKYLGACTAKYKVAPNWHVMFKTVVLRLSQMM
jgi:hypothetical protein